MRIAHLFAVGLAGTALIASAGCFGRSNARVVEVETTYGSGDTATKTVTEFDYDSNGVVSRVTIDNGGDETEYEIDYTDGRVTAIEVDFGATTLDHEFEWEGGRLVAKTESGEGYSADSDLEYDNNGRLVRVQKDIDRVGILGAQVDEDFDTEIEYDDNGRVATMDIDYQGTAAGIDLGSVSTDVEFSYDDQGRIEEIVTERNGNASDVDYTYEDGRLTEVDNDGRDIEIGYDDRGRIVEIDFRDEDKRVEITYDDGSASGLVATPAGLPHEAYFDVTGRSFADIDMRVLPTLLGL